MQIYIEAPTLNSFSLLEVAHVFLTKGFWMKTVIVEKVLHSHQERAIWAIFVVSGFDKYPAEVFFLLKILVLRLLRITKATQFSG